MAKIKASINFGLVHIPVEIESAEKPRAGISFNLLDSKDLSRIKNKRVNESTGKEVQWADILKGYEVEKGRYVTFTEDELKSLALESNRDMEIDTFISSDEIPLTMFETPYYLVPAKGGEKGYAILAKILAKTKKYAVVQPVLRNRENLGVIFAYENALMLGMLRYADELKKTDEVLPESLDKVKVTEKELSMAARLLEEMTGKFEPEKYVDHYEAKVKDAVEAKQKGKKVKAVKTVEHKQRDNVIDIAELLQRSIQNKAKKKPSKRAA